MPLQRRGVLAAAWAQAGFKTIVDFRRDNAKAFRVVFLQFVLLCRKLDLYGRELLAIDGTRIKAVNNKDRNFTRGSLGQFLRAADERLADYLARLDAGISTLQLVAWGLTNRVVGGRPRIAADIAHKHIEHAKKRFKCPAARRL